MLYKKLLIAGLNLMVVAGMHAAQSSHAIIGTEIPLVEPFRGSALSFFTDTARTTGYLSLYGINTFGFANIQDEIAKHVPKKGFNNAEQTQSRANYHDFWKEILFPFVCGAGIFTAGGAYMRYASSDIDWRYIAGLAAFSLFGGSLSAAYRTSMLKKHFENLEQNNSIARTRENEFLTKITNGDDQSFLAAHSSLWNGLQSQASSYQGYKSLCYPNGSDQALYPTSGQCDALTRYIVRDYIPARMQAIIDGPQEDDWKKNIALNGNRIGLRAAAELGVLFTLGTLAGQIKRS